jgi:glycosyltransferase involved in cell wall biosynthesis
VLFAVVPSVCTVTAITAKSVIQSPHVPSWWADQYGAFTAEKRLKETSLKILIVHNPYLQPGGEDVVFEQERRMLEQKGHEVVIYCRSNQEITSYAGIARLALVKRTVWASDSREELAELLVRERPDIVHVHNTFVMVSPSIFSACHEKGVPVVHTLHNYRLFCPAATFYRNGHICEECVQSLWRSVRYRCYQNSTTATATAALMLAVHRRLQTWMKPAHHYIALSDFARAKFIQLGLPANKIFVKPNFVHPDPGVVAEKEDYAVFVGRMSPEKGVGTLLDAWEKTSNRFPLVLLGSGPDRAHLEQAASRRGLSRVHFQGHLPRQQVITTIGKARFLVFCSEWYENFPVTIAEAFATGTPVICSRLGAMQEIISDGRTGLHFSPGDADDLARKMDWAWDHPGELSALGREARRDYETRYTAEVNYTLLMHIYRHAMAQA